MNMLSLLSLINRCWGRRKGAGGWGGVVREVNDSQNLLLISRAPVA